MIKYSLNVWHKMWEHPDSPRTVEVSCGEGIMSQAFFKNGKWHTTNGTPNPNYDNFIGWTDFKQK